MSDVGRAALVTVGAVAATFAVDRALKVGVEHALEPGEHVRGPLGIHLVRRTNELGIAGRRAGSPGDVALLAAGGTLALGVAGGAALLRRPTLLQVGAGMVAGAMLANLVDRATGRGVTDFVASPLGVLNGADIALGAGIVLAGIGMAVR